MTDFSHPEAKRLYRLSTLEREALEVLHMIASQVELGQKLDDHLLERACAIVRRYDRVTMRGTNSPDVIPFRHD